MMFAFMFLVFLFGSCNNESRMKSRISDAIVDSLSKKDKDYSVKVNSVGELYGCMWFMDDSTSNLMKKKLGNSKYDDLSEKAMRIGTSSLMGLVGTSSKYSVAELKNYSIEIDKALKDCGVKPIDWFTTCNITIENKVYNKKLDFVTGVMYNENNDGKPSFGLIPDESSMQESNIK